MSNLIRHPYHLVDESPWPLCSSIGAFTLTSGLIKWFYTNDPLLALLGMAIILLVMDQWWHDICKEGFFQGLHTTSVELGLRWGMILFIISEIFFFISFFWAFFHNSLVPDVTIGNIWPPLGISPFDPLGTPLVNTVILLTSGISVTWAHHAVMNTASPHNKDLHAALMHTVALGVLFLAFQYSEFMEASFTMADSIYGSTFFIATGFHGLHVLVGTIFLRVAYLRNIQHEFSTTHHFGLEAAAWYWHFVDVVWLFLYIWFYWWGGV